MRGTSVNGLKLDEIGENLLHLLAKKKRKKIYIVFILLTSEVQKARNSYSSSSTE